MTMRPPPPGRAPRSRATLVEDLMREIFLRLPPGDPKALVRAAAGCSSWRGIISEAAFARDYRKLHGAPPMLGFLYEELDTDEAYWVSHFISTAPFLPPACQDRPYWHVLDCRHGLVLFYTPREKADFVVCDLVAGNQWEIQSNPECGDIMRWKWLDEEENLERIRCNAAVLCANDSCDHLDCHGAPFRIALVGCVHDGSKGRATVYSSETREWSDIIEIQTPDCIEGPYTGHSALVGNKVYVPCLESDSVVEYNMGEQQLCVIDFPSEEDQPYLELMGVEDDMLLFPSVVKPRLYLWSMEVGPSRAAGWARSRVIELEPLLPPYVLSHRSYVEAIGFAQGVSVIFLKTKGGLYTIDLKSGEGKKVHERQLSKVMPYMSFYTGAWGQLLPLE